MAAVVSVYDATLTLIGRVVKRTGLTWSHELNTAGSFSMTVHLDDPLLTTLHPSILNAGRIVIISTAKVQRRAYLIESHTATYGADGAEKSITVSGRGVLDAILGNAATYPESPGTSGAIRWDQSDDRAFDYASLDGPWRVTSEWVTPVGLRWDDSSSIRKNLPAKWPDPAAQWLWITNPNTATAPQFNYFRGGFSLTSTTRIKIFAQGDERMRLKLDGEEIIVKGNRWWDLNVYETTLDAGYHLIGARVQALQHNGANNPAAFICSVAAVDRNGKILSWIKRSAPSGFLVRQLLPGGTAPGWYAASILKILVNEAIERNVYAFPAVTYGFSDTVDSSSVAWTGRHDRIFRIGSDYVDVRSQLTEADMDVDMRPDFTLDAWGTRGSVKAGVNLVPGQVQSLTVETNQSKVRNRALARGQSGWIQVADTTSAGVYGRRETFLVYGGALSDGQTERLSTAALVDLKDPEVTTTVQISDSRGPQPYVDFDIGDTVTSLTTGGGRAACRVMGLSATENDTGELVYTVTMYPVV